MTHASMEQSRPGMSLGLRKMTVNQIIAARLIEQSTGLPPGVKHPNQLLATFRRAAPFVGLTRLQPLLEYLFRWTYPDDWTELQEPIVWPSNEDIGLALGLSERQVSRLIAAAIEAKLIVAKDAPNRQRRGYRANGRLVWAWGLNLRPLAARYAEFVEAAEAGETQRALRAHLRRRASAARQSLARMLDLAYDETEEPAYVEERLQRARQIAQDLKDVQSIAAIEAAVASIEQLRDEARKWLDSAVNSGNKSSSPAIDDGLNIPTTTSLDPEGITVSGSARGSSGGDLSSPQPLDPDVESTGVTAVEMMELAPLLSYFVAVTRPDWNDLADGAALLAGHLGISKSLYAQACHVLGRYQAALAVAIVSTKTQADFHSSTHGGYFRGMVRKAETDGLNLSRSIFGLRERIYRRGRPAAVRH